MRARGQGWALLWGWVPIALLFTALIVIAHDGPVLVAARVALRMTIAGALLGVVVDRFCERHPWPRRFHPRFLLLHLAAAFVFAAAFIGLNLAFESAMQQRLRTVLFPGHASYAALGVWLYVMVAGISYATRATARAAALEAQAAKAQLAALQGQLHPHFLFNSLHTIVQLIDVEPRAAVRAAEQLAAALRDAIDERRSERPLRDELAFVDRYLALEALRFGPRLHVTRAIADPLLDARVPTFALQTLVENAVRHGAAPALQPTTLTLEASRERDSLLLVVHDDGVGAGDAAARPGGGLARLRDQLAALHGDRATLVIHSAAGGGYRATLRLPLILEQAVE